MTTPPRPARGQAAAMMALTMMLVALMVCITLGVGMKVKEKMETQVLADTSAYSGAILTARTFNSIAILNRVEIAEMVSVVATQSLVAYGGYYRAMLWSARAQLQEMHDRSGNCPDDGTCNWCSRYQGMMDAIDARIGVINAAWDPMDRASGDFIEKKGAAGTAYGAASGLYEDLFKQRITVAGSGNAFTDIIKRVDKGNAWPGELTAAPAADTINGRELGVATDCVATERQLICEGNAPNEISIQAAMGTRGYAFERDASNLSQMVSGALMGLTVMDPNVGEAVNLVGFQGSTRFVDRGDFHGRPGGMGIVGEMMEGTLQLVVKTPSGCGPQLSRNDPVQSWVYDTSVLNKDDVHFYSWLDATGALKTLSEPQGSHAFNNTDCPPYHLTPCGMWPGFLDLNPANVDPAVSARDLYGQPKVMAVVQRDYTVRGDKADPWNFLQTIQIRKTSGTQEAFDNNGIRTAQNLDISKQTAMATGLAYYHRQGHWKEPPNLYNPFWRATLVSGAIDSQGYPEGGGTDLRDAAAGAPFAQQVIDALSGAGFRGWQ